MLTGSWLLECCSLLKKRWWVNREVELRIIRERTENVKEISARATAKGDLPSVAKRGFFVKSRGGEADDEIFSRIFEVGVIFFGVFNGESFGFVGNSDFGKIIEWREMTELAFFENVVIETLVVGIDSGGDDRVVRLISLDENVGSI